MRQDLLALVGDAPLSARRPRPSEIVPGPLHADLAGSYRSEDYGDIRIERDAANDTYRLTMIDKPAYWSFHLTPVEGGFHWRAFGRLIQRQSDNVTMRVLPDGEAQVIQPLLAD